MRVPRSDRLFLPSDQPAIASGRAGLALVLLWCRAAAACAATADLARRLRAALTPASGRYPLRDAALKRRVDAPAPPLSSVFIGR